VVNNLRIKWYIWSPNRRLLCNKSVAATAAAYIPLSAAAATAAAATWVILVVYAIGPMCGPDLKRHLKTKHGQQKSKEKRCSPTYRGIYAAAAVAAAADRGIYAATGSCAIFSLVGPLHRKCPLGCSVGRPRPISSMATGTSPFTGYLPLLFSYNIIYFNNGFLITH
jgi:hypothetical protein